MRQNPQFHESEGLLPTHQEHYRLSEYLLQAAGADGMIDWRDVRPEEFHPSLFPSLVMYDVVLDEEGTPADFVYRIMGNRLIEFSKVNMTGKPLSTFPYPKIRDTVMEIAKQAHTSGRPIFCATYANVDGDKTLLTERSMYPIRRNGGPAILGLITVTKPPPPYSELFKEKFLEAAEDDYFRMLNAPNAWA